VPKGWRLLRRRLIRGITSSEYSLREVARQAGCTHVSARKWFREDNPTMPSKDKVEALVAWIDSLAEEKQKG